MEKTGQRSNTPVSARETIKESRRKFLRNSFVTGGTAASIGALGFPSIVSAQVDQLQPRRIPTSGGRKTVGKANHWYVPASDKTIHWGYFSKNLKPVVEVESGDFVTIEALTHQAGDDYERMIKGDPGAESAYY